MPDAGVVFGSMLVPDMCQVPEPSYDRQTTTTTKPTDDDEWVLIVNYKSSACSACGVLLSAWMMSAQLWRIITRFSGGVKCLPYPSIPLSSLPAWMVPRLQHMSNIQIARWPLFFLDFCLTGGGQARIMSVVGGSCTRNWVIPWALGSAHIWCVWH